MLGRLALHPVVIFVCPPLAEIVDGCDQLPPFDGYEV